MIEFEQDLLMSALILVLQAEKRIGRLSVLNEKQQRVAIEHLKAGSGIKTNVHVHHVHILLLPEQSTVKIFNLSKHHPLLHSQAPTSR